MTLAPEDYPRRVLLCAAGMTPPVVTETLYGLLQLDPPFVPTEIQLVTTTVGANGARKELIEEPRIQQLLEDYEYDPAAIRFDETCIHIPEGADGEPLDDLRTEDENARMANTILRVAADLSDDDDCAIHASIAGGRKTMSYYLGQVMSLLGRSQDTLSHVLVNPVFEIRRLNFYYPPREPVMLETPNGEVSTTDAGIDLAFIPFVRLQARLPKGWVKQLRQDSTLFTQAVAAAQLGVEPPRLFIDLSARPRTISIGRANVISFEMPLAALGLYTLAAARRMFNKDPAAASIKRQDLPLEAFNKLRVYGELTSATGDEDDEYVAQLLHNRIENSKKANKGYDNREDEKNYYDRCANEIRETLVKAAGPDAPEIYGLTRFQVGSHGLLRLHPEQIEIRWPAGNEINVEELPWD